MENILARTNHLHTTFTQQELEGNYTPKEYKIYCKKWNLKYLPLVEWVRCAVFSVESGITLDAEETEQGMPEELTSL